MPQALYIRELAGEEVRVLTRRVDWSSLAHSVYIDFFKAHGLGRRGRWSYDVRMKPTRFFRMFILWATLTSCAAPESPRAFSDKFAAAETKAWQTGDVADLKALEDPGVVYHLPGGIDLVGWQAHEDYIVKQRPSISSLKQDWKYLSGEGDHIVLSYDAHATMLGADNLPTKINSNFLFVLRLHQGRVAEVWANGTSVTTSDSAAK